MMLSSQVDRDEPLTIIGPPKIREYVETSRNVLDMYINYEVIVKEIIEPGEVYRGEGYSVFAFPLYHSKPCLGYTLIEDERPGVFDPDMALELKVPRGPLWSRLQHGESVKDTEGREVYPHQVMGERRSGRKFSYVTDTRYIPSIAPMVSGSDLFICEAMFQDELEESAAEKKHLTSIQAGRIASDAGGIRKMGLIHYSPRYTMRDLRKLLKEARTVFPDAFLTEDQQQIDIPFED
jgi:ribonuclease Z